MTGKLSVLRNPSERFEACDSRCIATTQTRKKEKKTPLKYLHAEAGMWRRDSHRGGKQVACIMTRWAGLQEPKRGRTQLRPRKCSKGRKCVGARSHYRRSCDAVLNVLDWRNVAPLSFIRKKRFEARDLQREILKSNSFQLSCEDLFCLIVI